MRISPRIIFANVVGLAIVAGALYLNQQRTDLVAQSDDQPAAATTNSAREFIPINDTNGNQTPDWLEAFNLQELDLTQATRTETVTSSMAEDLARLIVEKNFYNRDTSAAELAAQVRENHEHHFYDEQYTVVDINVSANTSIEALRTYGNRIVTVGSSHIPEGAELQNEWEILQLALTTDDPTVLEQLDPIIVGYTGVVEEMQTMPVPETMIREHLSLLNVDQAILSNVKAFRLAFDDPALGLLRYERYLADAEASALALILLFEKLEATGVVWRDDDVAGQFRTEVE